MTDLCSFLLFHLQERQPEVLDMSFPVFSGLASAKFGREAKMTKQMGLFFR